MDATRGRCVGQPKVLENSDVPKQIAESDYAQKPLVVGHHEFAPSGFKNLFQQGFRGQVGLTEFAGPRGSSTSSTRVTDQLSRSIDFSIPVTGDAVISAVTVLGQ